jgi:hypothetical protein
MSLVGLRLFVRQHGFALVHQVSNWTPPDDGNWYPDKGYYNAFRRVGVANHAVVVQKDRIVVAQILPYGPSLPRIGRLSNLALGADAADSIIGCKAFPLCMRVPLIASAEVTDTLPEEDFREMRIRPREVTGPSTIHVFATEGEMRVSGSRTKGRLQCYAEIYPCFVHQPSDVKARRMLYATDALKAASMGERDRARALIAAVSHRLVDYVRTLRDAGFEVDMTRRLPGRRIATVVKGAGTPWLHIELPPLYKVDPFSVPLGSSLADIMPVSEKGPSVSP